MTIDTLSRLHPVDLRTIWTSEAGDFTPWLAREKNLTLLGDTIGLELELEGVEKNVGPFRADIVCKDTASEGYVLIENQLEKTNHNHLGQLLTYAAGLNAVTIVWIADRFTDEHRAAVDWLNEVTNEDINLFGLEIELWQIADSPVAPKFNIISKPNDWIRTIAAGRQKGGDDISPTKALQLEYWKELKQHLEENGSLLKIRKPQPQHWMTFAVGRTGFKMHSMVNMVEGRIAVQFIMHDGDAKAYYHLLYQEKEVIEAEIGAMLTWRELPEHKQSDATIENDGLDPNDRVQWPEQHIWFQEQLEAFYYAFSPRVKVLEASDYVPVDEPEIL